MKPRMKLRGAISWTFYLSLRMDIVPLLLILQYRSS